MEYRPLGQTDIKVSVICLGTMTWGGQNTEAEAHTQLDCALNAGVNFIDTAEMYAIPPKAETFGLTERYIGHWLAQRGIRDKVILATKVTGPGLTHIRNGNPHHDRAHIEAAIHGSLERLQTDYIDLYQVHWPDRNTNFFGKLGYRHQQGHDGTPIEETLGVLAGLIKAGKIRYVGISNETPWGAMQYLEAASRLSLPRIVSIQNPYSLLNRTFEVGLAETAHREHTGLLAYSPLGFGVLSGKYLNDARPAGARLSLYPDYVRYLTSAGIQATEAYVGLAHRYNIKPAQLALAYVNSRPFVTSSIIGATNLTQLQENLSSAEITLSEEILNEIESIHQQHPNPCP